jgi:hypothetical protein
MLVAEGDDLLISNFEGKDYGAWTVSGSAFGAGPAHGTLPNQMPVDGFLGKGLVNSYAGGDEKHNLVEGTVAQRELARAERALLLAQGQLMILQYMRQQRNSLYARHSLVLAADTMTVQDLLENYPVPERLVQDICQRVQPASWARPGVRISISPDGTLSLNQSRDVILGVREYIEKLREDAEARKRAANKQ